MGCLTSQQRASVCQGRICSDNLTCCHTEIEVANPTFYLTQSQYTDTDPTIPSADPITPGAWQGSHWSANFEVTGMTQPEKIPAQAVFEPEIFRSRGGRLTTWPKRRSPRAAQFFPPRHYFEVTGMTRPRKNPGASGIRTQDLPLSRRTP